MAKISEIIAAIEQLAPLHLQEGYDNCGLQVGDANAEATAAVLCVDVTEAVIDEAIEMGANLVISHHPLIFRGIKRLTGGDAVQRMVMKAVKHDVAIYSAHTSIDNACNGVSWRMAQKLNMKNVRVLAPQSGKLVKVVVYVPREHAQAVEQAMHSHGAGNIGNYDCCSYRLEGEGRFRANDGANPFVGEVGQIHAEPETRVEVITCLACKDAVVRAMLAAHPYEEPAYDVIPLLNNSPHEGAGVVGDIEPVPASQFFEQLKLTFRVDAVRYCGDLSTMVSRVAMCGGSGAEFIGSAIASGAQVYVTGDVKYHDFTTNTGRIMIADIGHYESEQFTNDIFYDIIQKKMPNFATYYAKSENKQVKFFI
ncbi:MAG: Nif3-like dinuclear metal center hexameric protein [Muribaculaceae bacterium]